MISSDLNDCDARLGKQMRKVLCPVPIGNDHGNLGFISHDSTTIAQIELLNPLIPTSDRMPSAKMLTPSCLIALFSHTRSVLLAPSIRLKKNSPPSTTSAHDPRWTREGSKLGEPAPCPVIAPPESVNHPSQSGFNPYSHRHFFPATSDDGYTTGDPNIQN